MTDLEQAAFHEGYWSPLDGGNILLWPASPHRTDRWVYFYRRGREARMEDLAREASP